MPRRQSRTLFRAAKHCNESHDLSERLEDFIHKGSRRHSVIADSVLQQAFADATCNFYTEIYTYLIGNYIVIEK